MGSVVDSLAPACTRGSRSAHLCPHGSVCCAGEPEQDRRCGATRRKQIRRNEVDGLELHTSCPGTGRAVPRPGMGRAVSAARKSIAAANEAFRHNPDHTSVADYPPGQLSLCAFVCVLVWGRRPRSCGSRTSEGKHRRIIGNPSGSNSPLHPLQECPDSVEEPFGV